MIRRRVDLPSRKIFIMLRRAQLGLPQVLRHPLKFILLSARLLRELGDLALEVCHRRGVAEAAPSNWACLLLLLLR